MTTRGLWVSPSKFMPFAEPAGESLTGEIAVRSRSWEGFANFMLYLPNPDPVLKAQGQDIRVYRDLRVEAIVGGPLRRRTSAVQALEYGLEQGPASSRAFKGVQALLADLPINELVAQFVEAAYFGYAPQEILWQRLGGLTVPTAIVAKPQEWFVFGQAGDLRFRSVNNPLEGEVLPERKFLLPRQNPTYLNPYGTADLAMVFWPIVFKRGGLKFWLRFTEKYGMPWAVGKLPRSASPQEEDSLLNNLSAMIQDAVAVIPDDASVELKEAAGKGASADLYERLVMYCRSEINIALTGTNQTTESDTTRTMAGIAVADDLRDATAEIAVAAMNMLIRYVVDENWGGPAPVWSMWDQEARDRDRSARDKAVSESGARLTNRYWMRSYGYEEGDLGPEVWSAGGAAPVGPASAGRDGQGRLKSAPQSGLAFAEGDGRLKPAPQQAPDTVDLQVARMANEARPAMAGMVSVLEKTVAEATSFAELQDKLLAVYGHLDHAPLARIMAQGFEAAQAAGRFEARAEQ